MALPVSRNNTYVAGVSEVDAADLNDLQDKIVDIHVNNIHGARNLPLSPGGATALSTATIALASIALGASQQAYWELPLVEGQRINGIVCDILTNGGSVTVELHVHVVTSGGVTDNLLASIADATQLDGSAFQHTIAAGESIIVSIERPAGAGANPTLLGPVVTYDKLT